MPFIRRMSVARSKHARGLLRAGGYLAVLSLGLGAFQMRAAHAEVRNRTVELGRQMYDLAHASQHDVNKLTINGQPLWVGSSLAKDSVTDVLDRYEGTCEKNLAQPTENWRELAQKIDEKKEQRPALAGSGVMRGGGSEEGTVICFTKGESSKPTVREAFKSFVDTGELGALGNLRYVYARKSDQGRTVVLTAWTDDKFNLTEIIPKDGAEAKGVDFPGLPRPPEANRLMSAQVEGTPFGVNVYRTQQTPAAVVGFYDAEMTKRGWAGFDPEIKMQRALRGEDDKAGVIGRLYERDGVVLTLAAHADQGATIASLGLAGVTSTDGSKTDTGTKAAVEPPALPPGAVTKNASSASDP